MSKIAIVGGAGFIGRRLARTLQDSLVIDRSVPTTLSNAVVADVRDADRVAQVLEGVRTIYLLAAEHADDVEPSSLYYDVNVRGTRNVIAAAEKHSIRRIVFTSTVAVYGLQAPEASETTSPDPFNAYSKSKCEAERALLEWAHSDESRSLVIVRPCVVFGEGNRGNVYNLLRQLSSGRFLMVGDGGNRKSMAYVGNLVRFLEGLTESEPGVCVFNYADKPDLRISELIDIASEELRIPRPRFAVPYRLGLAAATALDALARVTRRKFPISAVRIRKFCADTTVNTERLASTGFVPPYSLEEGLRRTIRAEFAPATSASGSRPVGTQD